jgi:hypothetical protein
MSLHEQQNFLARLYTDENLRRAFALEPQKIGTENLLNETEIAELAAVFPEELDFFAASLVWKRLRETKKFLPLTEKILGADFEKLFRRFSQNYNPQTIKKHLADALEFSRFLQAANVSELAQTAARFERAKLEFFNGAQTLKICKLDYDIREIARDFPPTALKRKTKFAVWLRFGNRTRHFII